MSVADEHGPQVDLVPLNLAGLSEEEIMQRIPTPEQLAAALQVAREALSRAPKALAERSRVVKDARRDLVVAIGLETVRAQGASVEERRRIAMASQRVQDAQEAVDVAEIALEYAKEKRKALSEDIDLLRSMNANFRKEAR